MKICVLVLTQDTSRVGLYKSPLMHYLAVQGVDIQTQAFRPAMHYTGVLAQVLWIARLILLEIAVPQTAWPELGLQSKAEIQSISQRVHQLRKQHLCEGSYSPVSSILSQLAMGKKLNQQHESPANIYWAEDEQTIFYQGKGIQLAKVQGMCRGLVQRLVENLQELAFRLSLPRIELDQVIDSMAWSPEFRKSEYSFIQHPQNQGLNVGYQYLLNRAKGAQGNQQILSQVDGQYQWIESAKKAYLNQERQFLQKLLVGLHITGGQPARGPEIGSIKVSFVIYTNLYTNRS
jgi:hypothetical protein